MGLVDYSESSGSESDSPPKPAPKQPAAQAAGSKKPAFQKVVDRSNPGKIRVSLPQAPSLEPAKLVGDEPPMKRARTGDGGLFSGFNSFLPPPKNPAGKSRSTSSSTTGTGASTSKPSSTPRPGFKLKTSAEAAFSRNTGFGDGADDHEGEHDGPRPGPDLDLPAPKTQGGLTAPLAEQKPAEEVKLVGKPLMFKPLSVSRKPAKKKAAGSKTVAAVPTTTEKAAGGGVPATAGLPEPPKKKISLFGISEEPRDAEPLEASESYEPLFAQEEPAYPASYAAYPGVDSVAPPASTIPAANQPQDLASIADDLNLSAADRRELFGRQQRGSGAQQQWTATATAKTVINFNTDAEYRHNEALRAAGELQQSHNPVRAIAPGKHSLRQLVGAVQGQRDALEESFAKGKTNQREAAGRYGW